MLKRIFMAALVALAVAPAGAAFSQQAKAGKTQSAKPVEKGEPVGKWQCVAKTPEGESLKFYMEPKNETGTLSGSIRTAGGGFTIIGGTYAKGKLEMRLRTPEGVLGKVIATIKGAKLTGDWELSNGVSGDLSCSRAGRAPQG
jgi:hypothetical protein